MTAAELSSVTNTKSVSPIWASRSVVIQSRLPRRTRRNRIRNSDSEFGKFKLCLGIPNHSKFQILNSKFLKLCPPCPPWWDCHCQSAALLVSPDRLPRPPRRGQRAPPFPDVRFVLVPEMLQRRQHGRDRRVAEGAKRLAGNIRRNILQHVQIPRLPVALLDPVEDLVEPVRAF